MSFGKAIRLTSSFVFAASSLFAANPAPPPLPNAPAAEQTRLNVLILGDSLALCGFGKRLDERFRHDPRVNATYTYMACGTNPLSWLKQKPYTSIKAPCGYWSIEPAPAAQGVREIQDTYG